MFEKFLPRLRVNRVYDLDLDTLYASGYRYIMTDLDNTLVGAKAPLATPELIEWFKLVKEKGFKLLIVSNNNLGRVSAFSAPLNIEFVHTARKPSTSAFQRAMKMMGAQPHETIMIGDQLMTDIFGGNRLGLYTVLVLPIAVADEGWGTRINRKLEKFVKRSLKKAGLWTWEDKS